MKENKKSNQKLARERIVNENIQPMLNKLVIDYTD